jgi:tRNA (guanine-N7-)-methyltransferase
LIPPRKLHGRLKGKTLRPRQIERLARLEAIRLGGVSPAENPERRPLAGLPAPLWLEIGFGGGEHLAHLAALHPEVTLLGAEPFVNGQASLMRHLDERSLANVLVHPGDARDLLDVLPPASLARVFLLYPDPWPKARHHGRRFVTPEPLGLLARAMAPGAELRLATDIEDYARQALEQCPKAGLPLAQDRGAEPWPDWTRTRYEAKALRAGRAPRYLAFRRA